MSEFNHASEQRTQRLFSERSAIGAMRNEMQTLLMIIAIIAVIAGLVFIGQGSGYFPYPASSFMVKDTQWIYYGGAIAIAGLMLAVAAFR